MKYTILVPSREVRDPSLDEFKEMGEGDQRHTIRTRYGYREVPQHEVLVEVFVDFERIAQQLGVKAARSKSRKSMALSGAVVVKLVK